MYDISTRKRAVALISQGRSLNSVSKEMGISRSSLRAWQLRIEPLPRMRVQAEPCTRCQRTPESPENTRDYSYLLGLYLGDGCVSAHPRTGYYLRIACADAWPGLTDACEAAMRAVNLSQNVYRTQAQGCVSVVGYSRHWPCFFPQHGPGKKHERPIILETWQQHIVDEYPWEFLRGLIHSDGCRITNWTTRTIGGRPKRYEYPRYFFTNMSADIIRLYTDTLDTVGVEWKPSRQSRKAENISVARKASVSLMDQHIGPKY